VLRETVRRVVVLPAGSRRLTEEPDDRNAEQELSDVSSEMLSNAGQPTTRNQRKGI